MESCINIEPYTFTVKDNYTLVCDRERVLNLAEYRPVIINMTNDDHKTDEYIRIFAYYDTKACRKRYCIQHRTQLECDDGRYPYIYDFGYGEALAYLADF